MNFAIWGITAKDIGHDNNNEGDKLSTIFTLLFMFAGRLRYPVNKLKNNCLYARRE